MITIVFLIGLSTVSAENTTSDNSVISQDNTINDNTNIEKTTDTIENDDSNKDTVGTNDNSKTISKSSTTKTTQKSIKTASTKHSTSMSVTNKSIYYKEKVGLKATVVDKNTKQYAQSGNVTFKVNGITVGTTTVNNGKAYLTYDASKLTKSKYTITATFSGTSTLNQNNATGYLTLVKRSTKTTVSSINATCHDKVVITATSVDKRASSYMKNGQVVFKNNGITIGTSTMKNGKAYLTYNTANLSAKSYNITAKYVPIDSRYSTSSANNTLKLSKISTKITLPSVTTKTETKTNITATVKDSKGNLIKKGTVTFKIDNTKIGTVNVSNGKATISYTPKAIVKNYTITATYAGTNVYNQASSSSKLITKLKIYIKYWSSKGDITKNKVLYSNLVKSEITSDIIAAAKKGTPYVHLGDGNGKTVFITAGLHGSELSSQAAAIKLINTLATQNIHGDLYILPFVSPKITGNNTRNIGVNLNSVANQAGTISNNIYLFAKSKNAVALGDFHCTMPGGKPGKDVAMGSYNPRSSSAKLATYIANQCGVSKIIYNTAGSDYPGALEDYCNNHGITSVTCEVKTQHGTIASGSVNKSYSMMKALLKYYSLTS